MNSQSIPVSNDTIVDKLIAKNDELSKYAVRIVRLYYINTIASVTIVIVTIVLNALIMAARHLGLSTHATIIFAVVNLFNKGIELRFKYDHRALLLAEYQKDVKMLDTELHQIYIKAKLGTLTKDEVVGFDEDYSRTVKAVAHWFKKRDCWGRFKPEDQEEAHDTSILEDDEDDDDDLDRFFQGGSQSAQLRENLPDGMEAEMIFHYYKSIEDAKDAIYKRYKNARYYFLCATTTTLVMNILIILTLLLYDSPSLIAIMGGLNTVVKGFQLHFKWEIQKDQCERCTVKAKLLDKELKNLTIRHQTSSMETVELESFKRAFLAGFKEMAFFMRPSNSEW